MPLVAPPADGGAPTGPPPVPSVFRRDGEVWTIAGRLVELRAELDEAEAFGDRRRIERARSEIEFLTDQLASPVGLGGRPRRLGAAGERARAAVTQSIRAVLKKIAAGLPALRPVLVERIRTGTFCAYEPPPDGGGDWVL